MRLYYAVWSGPAFGNSEWASLSEDEKRNSVWSVRIRENGDFDPSDVRREFLLPDFFVSEEDIARAGYSHPVSDITFSTCGDRPVMLVAERGGIRNLGLGKEYAFAHPHEARALRYELDRAGAWRPVGRYDVGFYDRREEGQPYLRANCSGGIAFGLGYDEETWIADPSKTDEFVWMSGDALCSPKGPCVLPALSWTSRRKARTPSSPPRRKRWPKPCRITPRSTAFRGWPRTRSRRSLPPPPSQSSRRERMPTQRQAPGSRFSSIRTSTSMKLAG